MNRRRCSLPTKPTRFCRRCARLADRGSLTVVLITHKFREVMRFGQDVTVMRGGRVVATADVASTSIDELAKRMFGGSPA